LVIPEGYDPQGTHALIIAWHGFGMTAGWMRQLSGGVERFAGNNAIFVYPDAGKQSWDGGGDASPDVKFFDALVAQIGSVFCIDQTRIFTTGFSNGAFFNNALAQTRPKVIRAIAIVAGGGGGGVTMPAIVTHGQSDSFVDFGSGQGTQESWAQSDSCSADTKPFSVDPCVERQGCAKGYPVVWCPWSGNHDWPSFNHQAVWQFFSQF